MHPCKYTTHLVSSVLEVRDTYLNPPHAEVALRVLDVVAAHVAAVDHDLAEARAAGQDGGRVRARGRGF